MTASQASLKTREIGQMTLESSGPVHDRRPNAVQAKSPSRREFLDRTGIASPEDAVEQGMQEKSDEFRAKGGEVYQKA